MYLLKFFKFATQQPLMQQEVAQHWQNLTVPEFHEEAN
jgi:hypothetical protein